MTFCSLKIALINLDCIDNFALFYWDMKCLLSTDAFLIQASATLENLAELSEESGDNYTYSRLIQLYTQVL